MRLACPYQLSPTQNLLGNGMMASARNGAGGYLPSDNPASLVAWFRMGVGVTSSGGFASAWADQSGNGRDLLQATGTNQPAYDGSAILTFDGVDNWMQCAAFTWNQPTQVSMLVKIVTVISAGTDVISTGKTAAMEIYNATSTPRLNLSAGAVLSGQDAAAGSFHEVTALFAGASSGIGVDGAALTTGNAGTSNPGGFTLGFNTVGAYSNIAVKEIILRNVNDATIREDDRTYLLTL